MFNRIRKDLLSIKNLFMKKALLFIIITMISSWTFANNQMGFYDTIPIKIGKPVTGYVGPCCGEDWARVYKFELKQAGVISVFIKTDGRSPFEFLYIDMVGNIHETADANGRTVYQKLEAGTHWILIFGAANGDPNVYYSFTTNFHAVTESNEAVSNNEDINKNNNLYLNSVSTGHIGFFSPNGFQDGVDFYYINVPTEGDIHINCKASALTYFSQNQYISILLKTFNSAAQYGFDNNYPEANISAHLPAGEYWLSISGSGGYTLSNTYYSSSPPVASIANKSTLEGNTGTKQLKFPVTLSSAYTSAVKVKYKTLNNTAKAGSDYVAAEDSVIFKPGQTSKTVSITINGDTKAEPNETFYVKLYKPYNATVAEDTAIGKIRNDDGAALTDKFITSENIQSTSLITGIKAYPNPVKDILYIQTADAATFYLSDAKGKLILTKQIHNNGSINVSALPAGLYFLKNEATGDVQKIIVQK